MEQLDRIERKLNYLIIVAARRDYWTAFNPAYEGWNALSAFEDMMKKPENAEYLKP